MRRFSVDLDVRRYQRLCDRARRLSPNGGVDAVHDAFLETHCFGLEHFEARAHLRVKDQYRKRQRDLQRLIPRDLTQCDIADLAPDPPEAVARREQIAVIRSALRKLSPNYRQVVELRFFKDLPPAEIAKLVGVPVKTVYTRLRRAIERLRGIVLSTHGRK
ncbi:MAG: sigma-70 family RNA polymerase sigma factor [Planctomycetota bacterium]|nr:MAG: sigma-70 family RNA polymerase sigma factor [Planctomycetota bacterium]